MLWGLALFVLLGPRRREIMLARMLAQAAVDTRAVIDAATEVKQAAQAQRVEVCRSFLDSYRSTHGLLLTLHRDAELGLDVTADLGFLTDALGDLIANLEEQTA